jgi:hypothetical protein
VDLIFAASGTFAWCYMLQIAERMRGRVVLECNRSQTTDINTSVDFETIVVRRAAILRQDQLRFARGQFSEQHYLLLIGVYTSLKTLLPLITL